MTATAHFAKTTTATIALIAGGSLLTLTAKAESATGENRSEIPKQSTPPQGWDAALRVDPADDLAGMRYLGASFEKRAAGGKTDAAARKHSSVASNEDPFRPDPQYDDNYDAQFQADVYGDKYAVDPPRPAIEFGREQYTSGSYDESSTVLGVKNPLLPGFAVYGDWRTAVAYNNNNGKDIA